MDEEKSFKRQIAVAREIGTLCLLLPGQMPMRILLDAVVVIRGHTYANNKYIVDAHIDLASGQTLNCQMADDVYTVLELAWQARREHLSGLSLEQVQQLYGRS